MNYHELMRANRLMLTIENAGFAINSGSGDLVVISALSDHEQHKEFGFIEDNRLAGFKTIEEACAFIAGWQECKSMMKISGQTK